MVETCSSQIVIDTHRLTAQQVEDPKTLDEFWNLKFVDISDNGLKSELIYIYINIKFIYSFDL